MLAQATWNPIIALTFLTIPGPSSLRPDRIWSKNFPDLCKLVVADKSEELVTLDVTAVFCWAALKPSLKIPTMAAPPKPMLCVRPYLTFLTCLLSAWPLNCQLISAHWAMPVAPK